MRNHWIATITLTVIVSACTDQPDVEDPATPQDVFWASLQSLCGQAFGGEIVESEPPDSTLTGQPLVMHVRECAEEIIRVPFFIGENRSRTWIFSRTDTGLRLKHEHRHEDGTEDAVTQYGGDTAEDGSGTRQQFAADNFTATLLPAAAANVWTVMIMEGETFVYGMQRIGTDRAFRAEFDLDAPVEIPPPPWGAN